MSNSDHTLIGAEFQVQVRNWFQKQFGSAFELEVKMPIGSPAKVHKFDVANVDRKIVIECKRYTWTETGNVPSAKIRATNEAAFFLSFLPNDYDKYIVMLHSHHKKKHESLAEYYFRTYNHLVGRIKVAEYDPETDELRIIKAENK